MYLVECYNDGTLLLTLGLQPKAVKRQYGKGNVIKALRNTKREDLTCIMDLDRNKTGMQGLPRMKHLGQENGLILYQWQGHHVIMVDDYLEDWLVRMVHRSGHRMMDFGLPDDARAVHRLERRESDGRVVKVIQHLLEAGSPGIITLQQYLRLRT